MAQEIVARVKYIAPGASLLLNKRYAVVIDNTNAMMRVKNINWEYKFIFSSM